MGHRKAVLSRKFLAIQSHLKKQEKSQINNLTLHLKQLEKEEQRKPKVSRKYSNQQKSHGLSLHDGFTLLEKEIEGKLYVKNVN